MENSPNIAGIQYTKRTLSGRQKRTAFPHSQFILEIHLDSQSNDRNNRPSHSDPEEKIYEEIVGSCTGQNSRVEI